jgi:hypothetical protein
LGNFSPLFATSLELGELWGINLNFGELFATTGNFGELFATSLQLGELWGTSFAVASLDANLKDLAATDEIDELPEHKLLHTVTTQPPDRKTATQPDKQQQAAAAHSPPRRHPREWGADFSLKLGILAGCTNKRAPIRKTARFGEQQESIKNSKISCRLRCLFPAQVHL